MNGPALSLGQVKVGKSSAKSPESGPPLVGGPVRCVGSLPEFAKVRVKVLDWVSSTFPKFIGFGESDRWESSPVPDRLTWSGLLGALLTMLSVAERAPAADGVNVTEMVHVPVGATVAHPAGDAESLRRWHRRARRRSHAGPPFPSW